MSVIWKVGVCRRCAAIVKSQCDSEFTLRSNKSTMRSSFSTAGPFWAYQGLFGADWDQFLRTSQPLGDGRNSPERAFLWAQLAPFGQSPRLLSPPFGFPREKSKNTYHSFRNHYIFNSKTFFYVSVTVIFGK